MRYMLKYAAVLYLLVLFGCVAEEQRVPWHMNSLKMIGGARPDIIGDPKLVTLDGERVLEFDGVDDGLLVPLNPIAGMEEFTITVEFKPYDAYPENIEQRFLHIQDPENDSRRILIELRLNDRNQWYADWFMRTDSAALTLVDSTHTHPVGEWATISLEYQNGQMKGYVNGQEELSGEIAYMPISESAKTSLGTRMDKRSWFKGAIKAVEIRKLP